MKNAFKRLYILLIIGITTSSFVYAQSAIGQLETMSGGKVSRSSSLSSATRNSMITGSLLQGLFNSLLNSQGTDQKELDAKQQAAKMEEIKVAEQAAKQRKIMEAIAQAEYDKMMQSYKLLDDAQNLKIKTLDGPDLNFKTLDGEAEALSSEAQKQFESGSVTVPPSAKLTDTRFFGDVLPAEDLQALVDLDNKPNIVDLRDADKYIEEKTAEDSTGIVTLLRNNESEGNGEPIIMKPDCIKLREQLKGYINQREQFKNTIELSQSELNIWETANNNAMMNAAKDGLEFFTGELLEGMANRGKAAERLQLIYNTKANQMKGDGINVLEIQAKIDRLRTVISAGQIAEFTSNVKDWETFARDGLSSLLSKLNDSNNDINGIFEDPMVKKYFETEKPELKTLLDISKLASANMVFGKWVARKMPFIAVIEISIKQSYNALDYLLSLNRIIEAKKINGGVMDTARYIQKNIDDTYLALTNCQQ
jgi:hypothetical protein